MPQPPIQDFTSGVAFTGLTTITGALIDQITSTMIPNPGDSVNNIAGVLVTTDSAVGVPIVPDAVTTAKWQGYIWIRRPNLSDINLVGKIYLWNNALAIGDPTYKKWIATAFDPTAINNSITSLQTQVTAAINNANTANTNSTNALNTSNAANTTAVNASNSVAAATAAASAASTLAGTANTLASQANTTANAAIASANSAVAAAAGNKTIAQINPGTVGQRIRTNDGGNTLEYYNEINTIVSLSEQTSTGVNSAVFSGSANATRVLNNKIHDLGNLVSAFAANAFTLAKGVYKFQAHVPVRALLGGFTAASSRLFNVTDSVIVEQGQSVTLTSSGVPTSTVNTIVEGFFTTDGTKSYRLETFASGAVEFTGGNAVGNGNVENYTMITLTKVG